jgi:hypothetical protein
LETIIRTFGEKMIPLFGVELSMPAHKFQVGEIVHLSPGRNVPGGPCEVIMQLPERNGVFEYRVKSMNEPHERVVGENELHKS